MAPPFKRQRLSGGKITDPDLQHRKVKNDSRLKSVFESIFDKYGTDFDGIGDEIDLRTGEIVVNNGHILGIRSQTDTGLAESSTEGTASEQSSEVEHEGQGRDGGEDPDRVGIRGLTAEVEESEVLSKGETTKQVFCFLDSLVQDARAESPSAVFDRSLQDQLEDYDSEEDELADREVEWVTPREARAIASEKWQLPGDGPIFQDDSILEEAWRAPPLPKPTLFHQRIIQKSATLVNDFSHNRSSTCLTEELPARRESAESDSQRPDWEDPMEPCAIPPPQGRFSSGVSSETCSSLRGQTTLPCPQKLASHLHALPTTTHISHKKDLVPCLKSQGKRGISERTYSVSLANDHPESTAQSGETISPSLHPSAGFPPSGCSRGSWEDNEPHVTHDTLSIGSPGNSTKKSLSTYTHVPEVIDLTSEPDNSLDNIQNLSKPFPFASRTSNAMKYVCRGPICKSLDGDENADHGPVPITQPQISAPHPNQYPSNRKIASDVQHDASISAQKPSQFSLGKPSSIIQSPEVANDVAARRRYCIDRLLGQKRQIVSHNLTSPSNEYKGPKGDDEPSVDMSAGVSHHSLPLDSSDRSDAIPVVNRSKGFNVTKRSEVRQAPVQLLKQSITPEGLTTEQHTISAKFQRPRRVLETKDMTLTAPFAKRHIVQVVVPVTLPMSNSHTDFEHEEESADDITMHTRVQSSRTTAKPQYNTVEVMPLEHVRAAGNSDSATSNHGIRLGVEIPDSEADSSSPLVEKTLGVDTGSSYLQGIGQGSPITPRALKEPDRQLTTTDVVDSDLIDELSLAFESPNRYHRNLPTSSTAAFQPSKSGTTMSCPPRGKRRGGMAEATTALAFPSIAMELSDCSEDELSFM